MWFWESSTVRIHDGEGEAGFAEKDPILGIYF